MFEKKKMLGIFFLKLMCKSKRVEAGAKSERAKWEPKGKLLPFFAYIFFSTVFFPLCFFSFLLLEKKKMLGENT